MKSVVGVPWALALAAWLLIGGAGIAMAAEPAEPIVLRLPLDCVPGETCDIIKYVDNDPGTGMRDYACGKRVGGENGYGSTSIAIQDGKAMAQGVAVRAAADGVVERSRDGMADTGIHGPETREELVKVGCGNAVVLGHRGGWSTIYCHMRQGSIRVKPGDRVTAGDVLGMVGMSGLTELPHLFFSVRQGSQVIDPFVGTTRKGACGPGERPLWDADTLKKLVYRPVLLRQAGFAADVPTLIEARKGTYATAVLPKDTPEMHFWIELIGVNAGDRLALQITDPQGRSLGVRSLVFNRDTAQNFAHGLAAKATAPGAALTTGTWRGTATLKRGTEEFSVTRTIEIR